MSTDIDTLRTAVDQALRELLPPQMDTAEARVLGIAIGLQESRGIHRRQLTPDGRPKGPAAGLWHFEIGGGCTGVLRHASSRYWMVRACRMRGVEPLPRPLWDAIQTDDILAAAAARLLLFTDPLRLPAITDAEGGWHYYIRNWRPGKPHRHTWDGFHMDARLAVELNQGSA